MGQNRYKIVGKVRGDNQFRIAKRGASVVDTTVNKMTESYKSTFKEY